MKLQDFICTFLGHSLKAGLNLHKFHETKSHRSREELSFKQYKEDKVTRVGGNERHYDAVDLTELVLADVHQLLGGQQAGVGAPPDVRLLLAARSKGLKGSIVNKLGLFHHLTSKIMKWIINIHTAIKG